MRAHFRPLFSLERRGLWRQAGPLRKACRESRSEAFRALIDQRYQAIKHLYREHPFWWCNKNAVVASFDVALGRLGPGQELRAVRARGGQVQYANGASTATCFRCGHQNDFASHKAIALTCKSCGELWDQDYNTARGAVPDGRRHFDRRRSGAPRH